MRLQTFLLLFCHNCGWFKHILYLPYSSIFSSSTATCWSSQFARVAWATGDGKRISNE